MSTSRVGPITTTTITIGETMNSTSRTIAIRRVEDISTPGYDRVPPASESRVTIAVMTAMVEMNRIPIEGTPRGHSAACPADGELQAGDPTWGQGRPEAVAERCEREQAPLTWGGVAEDPLLLGGQVHTAR